MAKLTPQDIDALVRADLEAQQEADAEQARVVEGEGATTSIAGGHHG